MERVLTDFGADCSFAKAVEKVREHYGCQVSISLVREATQKHGNWMRLDSPVRVRLPKTGVRQLIAELDGAFVPIVETAAAGDRRKTRSYKYAEARLCLAGQVGSLKRRYRATMRSVEDAGRQWKACVVEAGGGQNTKLHCVGDGAKWIVRQVVEQFGEMEAKFLVDFYHLSDYLAKAGEAIAGSEAKSWLAEQQRKMKNNKVAEVLAELGKYVEAENIADTEAPVRNSQRYIINRQAYLDYQGAIEGGLPIGSGEIESGNKSVVQSRLKIAGAWWKAENAEKMLALRVNRANGEWSSYWKQQRQASA